MSPYSQVFGSFPYRKKTQRKVVAITFDDGPNEPYTSDIVRILNKKHIKATFFMVGDCVRRYPEVAQKIAHSGHEIGNHSMTHNFMNYILHPSYRRELEKSQTVFQEVLGSKPQLFRPPWLWRTPMLLRTAQNMNLRTVSGEFCDVFEIFQPNGETIARRARTKIKPGSIIIFHDGYNAKGAKRSETVHAVELLTDELIRDGYEFAIVSELLGSG